jgi:hypothetical protein
MSLATNLDKPSDKSINHMGNEQIPLARWKQIWREAPVKKTPIDPSI